MGSARPSIALLVRHFHRHLTYGRISCSRTAPGTDGSPEMCGRTQSTPDWYRPGPRFILRPFCRPGHVLDIQVLKRDQSMVFAYVVRDLLKMVQTNRQHPANWWSLSASPWFLNLSRYANALRFCIVRRYHRPMRKSNAIRHGRHCFFNLHVHLVFVAKYRKAVFRKNTWMTCGKYSPGSARILMQF